MEANLSKKIRRVFSVIISLLFLNYFLLGIHVAPKWIDFYWLSSGNDLNILAGACDDDCGFYDCNCPGCPTIFPTKTPCTNPCCKPTCFPCPTITGIPTLTPTLPEATPTTKPTVTPIITVTPTSCSPTSSPVLTPTLTVTPTPTKIDPAPTNTPTHKATNTPIPEPTDTPGPEATNTPGPEATSTPQPTVTPTTSIVGGNGVVNGIISSSIEQNIQESNPLVEGIKEAFEGRVLGDKMPKTSQSGIRDNLPTGGKEIANTSLFIPSLGLNKKLYKGERLGNDWLLGDKEIYENKNGDIHMIYGHNTSDVFAGLRYLKPGDTVVRNEKNRQDIYKIVSIARVSYTSLKSLNYSGLTLVTCDPWEENLRLIVKAEKL